MTLVSDLIAARAHTPGPWSVGSAYGLVKTEVIAPDSSRAVCTVWTSMSVADRETGRHVVSDDPEGYANARLIAAAPELKDALAAMLDCWGGYECPEVDAAILVMQKLGEDRWSMQAQMDAAALAKSNGAENG